MDTEDLQPAACVIAALGCCPLTVDWLSHLPAISACAKPATQPPRPPVNEFVKRVRALRTHMLLLGTIRARLPLFGKDKAQRKLLDNLPAVFAEVGCGCLGALFAQVYQPAAGSSMPCGQQRPSRQRGMLSALHTRQPRRAVRLPSTVHPSPAPHANRCSGSAALPPTTSPTPGGLGTSWPRLTAGGRVTPPRAGCGLRLINLESLAFTRYANAAPRARETGDEVYIEAHINPLATCAPPPLAPAPSHPQRPA